MGRHAPIRIYTEPGFISPPRVFLDEETYGKAIQSFPIVCTDAAIVDPSTETIFLAKRRIQPAIDWWWIIGGRSFAGENEFESMQRCFKRETGLGINEKRFRFIRMNRYHWEFRQQEPQDAGSDNLCYTFFIELTPVERSQIILDPSEYYEDSLIAFNRKNIQETEGVSKQIIDLYKTIFPK